MWSTCIISLTILCSSHAAVQFAQSMTNETASTGREAVFTCVVRNGNAYKVAFLRVDTQTILSIDELVVTRNTRISVRYSIDNPSRQPSGGAPVDAGQQGTRGNQKSWQLVIKDVQVDDQGGYMCQVNTEPMISQTAYLHVTVAPDILVNESSSDVTVDEGASVSLKCSAVGYPTPSITWRREDNQPIVDQVWTIDGAELQLVDVSRHQMAAYLCIASNGIPPSVSKRIRLSVQYSPQVEAASDVHLWFGEPLTLRCLCYSFPLPLTSWNRQSGSGVARDYETHVTTKGVVTEMVLSIREMDQADEGNYTCACINTLGTASRTISVSGERNPTDRWTSTTHWSSEEEQTVASSETVSETTAAAPLDTRTQASQVESTKRSVSHSLILPVAPSAPPPLTPLKRNDAPHLPMADALPAVPLLLLLLLRRFCWL